MKRIKTNLILRNLCIAACLCLSQVSYSIGPDKNTDKVYYSILNDAPLLKDMVEGYLTKANFISAEIKLNTNHQLDVYARNGEYNKDILNKIIASFKFNINYFDSCKKTLQTQKFYGKVKEFNNKVIKAQNDNRRNKKELGFKEYSLRARALNTIQDQNKELTSKITIFDAYLDASLKEATTHLKETSDALRNLILDENQKLGKKLKMEDLKMK